MTYDNNLTPGRDPSDEIPPHIREEVDRQFPTSAPDVKAKIARAQWDARAERAGEPMSQAEVMRILAGEQTGSRRGRKAKAKDVPDSSVVEAEISLVLIDHVHHRQRLQQVGALVESRTGAEKASSTSRHL